MSRPETDVRTPQERSTANHNAANHNAAKRQAKAQARQRKAQQRRDAGGPEAGRPRPGGRARPDHKAPAAAVVKDGPTVELAPPAVETETPADSEAPPVDLSPARRAEPGQRRAFAPSDRAEPSLTSWLFDQESDMEVTDLSEPVPRVESPAERAVQRGRPRKRRPAHLRRTSRRRHSVLELVAGLAVLLVGGALAWRTLLSEPPGRLSLGSTGLGVESLLVGRGVLDLAGLAREARLLGRPDALHEVAPNTYLLSMPLTIEAGGHVVLRGAELRLASQPGSFVGLEARGGDLTLRGAVVTSWDPGTGGPDTDVADGRAYMLARDGARLDVVDSSASMLGYDAYERYGVSWRTSGTGGTIDRSTFSGNFYGAYMNGVEPMTITGSVIERSVSYGLDPHSDSRDFTIVGNTFRDNGKHGLILAEDCAGAVVRDNDAYGNREHGIVVFAGSDDVVVTGNRVHDNGGAGISVNGSARVAVRDNDLWANSTGVTAQDGATEAMIEGNRVSSNREDGVLISSEQSTATVVANRIDHNGRAGVWVSGGQAAVGPANRIANNESGVRLVDETASVRVFDNLVTGNYKDGFSLVVSDGLSITGNRIVDSEVAFSVRTAGSASPFLEGNTLSGNESGPERVREPEPEAEPLP